MERSNEKLRIDKYLWAIRIYKTRTLATEACKGGKVKLNGQSVKPAYEVKLDDVFQIQKGLERKTVKVIGLLSRRADAKTAAQHYEDITPPEDAALKTGSSQGPLLRRSRGTGRPTKKERRDIDNLQQDWFSS